MNDLFSLDGKVTVITGGAGGIGRALALGFAESGSDIAIADIEPERFESWIKNSQAADTGKWMTAKLDVTSEQSVTVMVEKVLEVYSHIDILINAAGINITKPAAAFPIEEWQKVMDVNARGTFLSCQAVGRVMIKQGSGKIINISSVRGRYGLKEGPAAYCSSKGAVDTLTRTLACEWAKYNILVNALAPTVVETEFTRKILENPESSQALKDRIPLGRWAMPEDIVGPALFLASKASDFITGQVLYVDGGLTTW